MIKMQSILEEFAYGTVIPRLQASDKSSEYGKVMALAACNEQKLLERLGAEDKKLFENYVGSLEEACRLAEVKNLMHGFKLGLTMTAEAFMGIDDLYISAEDL
jgi:hypothetical protein